MLLLLLLVGCLRAEVPYEVPVLPAGVIAKQLKTACERGAAQSKPLLVELGAEWCAGCIDLLRMEARAPLTGELHHWQRISVNVGQFDQHRGLIEAWGVEEIPHWALVFGADCSASADKWTPFRSRPVRVGSVLPKGLAEYLEAIRGLPKDG